ncbi:MAG: hypothetical protein VX652_04840, partial [Candidatus Thermoplasmatota archaeon]|nr:hypothetical protein [Candidatus Thermoplasmatota archaeon]
MTAPTKAITMCLLMITATSLAGCASDDGEPAPVTHVPPIDVRPFENQGVGIQFWSREWMPSEDDAARAELIESLDLLTGMNVNYIHIHFNVLISGDQSN